jgi:LysM repeat protein
MADEEGVSFVSFPWKMSKLFAPKQPRPRESLPAPPSGMEWQLEETTNEWKLVKSNALATTTDNAAAVAVTEGRPPMIPVTPDRDLTSPRRSPVASHPGVVDRLPSRTGGGSEREDDWEWLSERNSHTEGSNSGHEPVLVPRSSGSVRSIVSVEDGGGGADTLSSHLTPQSVPFKIQRTASSSTIDSQDAAIGPLGKGVLGVDYVEHVILPTDTLQGICLAYNISSTKLRQANHFSGNSLLLAPKKLVIPLSKKALRAGYIRVQDTDAKEYKLHAFLAEFSDLSLTEAKA